MNKRPRKRFTKKKAEEEKPKAFQETKAMLHQGTSLKFEKQVLRYAYTNEEQAELN